MNLRWSVLARADLQHIHAYIAQDNPRAAQMVIAEIRRAIRGQLGHSPLAGRNRRVDGTRDRVVSRLPCIVACRVEVSGIQVLRVLHCPRQWPD